MLLFLQLTQNTQTKQVIQEKGEDRFWVVESMSTHKTAFLWTKEMKVETPISKQLLKEAEVKARKKHKEKPGKIVILQCAQFLKSCNSVL